MQSELLPCKKHVSLSLIVLGFRLWIKLSFPSFEIFEYIHQVISIGHFSPASYRYQPRSIQTLHLRKPSNRNNLLDGFEVFTEMRWK